MPNTLKTMPGQGKNRTTKFITSGKSQRNGVFITPKCRTIFRLVKLFSAVDVVLFPSLLSFNDITHVILSHNEPRVLPLSCKLTADANSINSWLCTQTDWCARVVHVYENVDYNFVGFILGTVIPQWIDSNHLSRLLKDSNFRL